MNPVYVVIVMPIVVLAFGVGVLFWAEWMSRRDERRRPIKEHTDNYWSTRR